MKELLEGLSKAPATQADPAVARRCAEYARNGYQAAEIKALLDEVVHGSLASDFFVQALDIVWKDAQKAEA